VKKGYDQESMRGEGSRVKQEGPWKSGVTDLGGDKTHAKSRSRQEDWWFRASGEKKPQRGTGLKGVKET